ncbi:hypothetical protein GTY87_24715 [Streptomyces sp. SID7813]|uniref:Uncharacterized protein n=1 Tax=Streptomyces coelicolor (strain ATCC BAA-471 / A3(2) / M145) TaxID=100226 RepID=Q9K3J7_STRCO|nr:hypothetical protein [Streptomyces sp. SID7813]QFI44745.1 hypothetical protein FQ762_24940 [Streptomyces coelicolor A3(2)]CAB97426.1 hypothetical protein SC2A6.08 [Streptomyces coelicolor A3(2)]
MTELLLVQPARKALCKRNNIDHERIGWDVSRGVRKVPVRCPHADLIGTGGRSSARMGA